MLRPHRVLFLFLLAAAAGCTPMQWVRPGAGVAQLHEDLEQCRQEAWREATWRGWFYRPLTPTVVHDAHGNRFLAWPHSPFNDPFGDRFFEESRLTSFCMRAKGYALEPVPQAEGK